MNNLTELQLKVVSLPEINNVLSAIYERFGKKIVLHLHFNINNSINAENICVKENSDVHIGNSITN